MDALHELSEDFLTCCICLDRYKNPKQLPCLHSFCRDCLSDHIKANDTGGLIAFPCPECRKIIRPPSSTAKDPADEFPDNFYIAGMVSSMVQRGVTDERQDSKMDGDDCPNHPDVTCEDFCTKANVGVCTACQVHHRSCKEQHIPVHQAKNQVFSQVATLKVKMTSLLKNAQTINESLVDIPSNIRLRKEELLSDISQHFAIIKTSITKSLIEKEKEMVTKLKDVLKQEENWAGEALDENQAITQHCTKDIKFLDEQNTKRSLNASVRLRSMQELVEKFKTDLSRLESESDMKKIKYVTENLDDLIGNLSLGDIRSPHTTVEGAEITPDSAENSAPPPRPVSQPLIPSAPILLDEHGRPTWDLARYSTPNQPLTTLAPYLSPIITPSNHEYSGMVIRRKGPQTSKHRQKEADRLYMERLNKGKHIDTGNTKKLLPTAELRCRDRQDTRQCKFVGITAVAEDAFLLADRWNKNLKLVKLKGPVVKAFPLKYQEPWDATRVLTSKRHEIAITFPGICSIVFVEYEDAGQGPKLDIRKEIRTAVGYGSLGCINHEELICGVCNPFGSPRIEIVSMQGRVLRKFEDLVTYPRSIDTSPGHVIAVSDWTQKKVLLLQENGKVINTFYGPWSLQPKGVAYYEDGSFLVVDQATGCLHKVSEEGKVQMTVKVAETSTIVACVPTSSSFCKGLAIVIASDDGLVRVYDATQLE